MAVHLDYHLTNDDQLGIWGGGAKEESKKMFFHNWKGFHLDHHHHHHLTNHDQHGIWGGGAKEEAEQRARP